MPTDPTDPRARHPALDPARRDPLDAPGLDDLELVPSTRSVRRPPGIPLPPPDIEMVGRTAPAPRPAGIPLEPRGEPAGYSRERRPEVDPRFSGSAPRTSGFHDAEPPRDAEPRGEARLMPETARAYSARQAPESPEVRAPQRPGELRPPPRPGLDPRALRAGPEDPRAHRVGMEDPRPHHRDGAEPRPHRPAFEAGEPRAEDGPELRGRVSTDPPDPRSGRAEGPEVHRSPDLGDLRRLDAAEASAFVPREPKTLVEAGLDPAMVELLLLRYLLARGSASARIAANDICLPTQPVSEVLEQLRAQKLIQHRGATSVGDFVYEPTEMGRNKALESRRVTSYVGPAPVPWEQYLVAVRQQTLTNRRPTAGDLERAFSDLLVSRELLGRLGPAITSGRAMFLFGDPGNGKTSIAERVTAVFGDTIWIPHTLSIDGHLVKPFDPATHEEVSPTSRPSATERIDRRWVQIKRPTVVAGGELTLDMLEIQMSSTSGVGEAPLQIKANGGTLVIDDFGRQGITPQRLLNRWIFPLERRQDFLRLPDGRKIVTPFDCLLIFSTNLEPHDLVDEAFLRRIPYKIQVQDPSIAEFVWLVEMFARKLQVALPPGSVDYLLQRHYVATKRGLRFCHPRDLLLQVVSRCSFERRALVATPDEWDVAVENYFSVL